MKLHSNALKQIIDSHEEFPFCLGLDPSFSALKKLSMVELDSKKNVMEALRAFNATLLSIAKRKKMIIKPQSGFYECWGLVGNIALHELFANANVAGVPILLDAKRGDIGKTLLAYNQAYILTDSTASNFAYRESMEFPQAVTVNPFLGLDSVEPFFKYGGAFILLRTSNPDADQIQEAITKSGETVSEVVKNEVLKNNSHNQYKGFGNVGVVVGATKQSFAKKYRQELANTLFLVPGFGTQGGEISGIKEFFIKNENNENVGAIINIGSSAVSQEASNWSQFENRVNDTVTVETERLLEELNK